MGRLGNRTGKIRGITTPGPLRILLYMGGTRATNGGAVDGSEIRRSPVEIGSRNPIIYKVLEYISGGARFQPSTVPMVAPQIYPQ